MINGKITGLLLALLSILGCTAVSAQQLIPAEKGSKVEFKIISHRSSEAEVVKGTFGNIKGSISFDPKQLSKASFDITVGTASVFSGIADVDKDLKRPRFLDPQQYPLIRIKSASVTIDRPDGTIYVLHGNLTMKGLTKPVNIQFMATPTRSGYTFRGSFQLNRLLFDIGEKGDLEDNVSVYIEVRANRK